MKRMLLNEGKGRTRVSLSAQWIGKDLIVCLFNKQGHLGAVAVADFSDEENRASTSVITRLGHKDDSIAYYAAYNLCKRLRKPVCAIAGIHLDNITEEEITQISQNCDALVDKFSRQSLVGSRQ
jgi:gallate decarboxylase subunit D